MEEAMRKIFIVFIGLLLFFVGCYRIEEYEIVRYKAPNWTSDGRIVFVEDYNFVRDKHSPTGIEGNIKGGKEILTLCEIDRDGKNLRQIVKLAESPDYAYSLGITNTSSAGDLVAIAMRTVDSDHDEVFVVKRDGTELKNLGEGSYPDLSPDGKSIVYQKPNQGLWIMNIDGSGDRQIVGAGTQPAWSPDGWRIAYTTIANAQTGGLIISDSSGNELIDFSNYGYGLGFNTVDWAPPDSNAIITAYYGEAHIIYLGDSLQNRVVQNAEGYGWGWCPNGEWLCSQTSQGILVIKFDGSSKHYIKP